MNILIIAGIIVLGALLALPSVRHWGRAAAADLTGMLSCFIANLRKLNAVPLHEWDGEYVFIAIFFGMLTFLIVFFSAVDEQTKADFFRVMFSSGGE